MERPAHPPPLYPASLILGPPSNRYINDVSIIGKGGVPEEDWAMIRCVLIAGLILLLAGCSHSSPPKPDHQHGWVSVNVEDNSVDVHVRPETNKGNTDVHVDWP
jgi:hypothetical protein